MKYKIKLLSLVLPALLVVGNAARLNAESALAKGDKIFSLSVGRGVLDIIHHDDASPKVVKAEGLINLSSTIQERRMLGYLQYTLPAEEVRSNQSALQFEYLVFRMLGIRFGVGRFKAVYDNVLLYGVSDRLIQSFIYNDPCASQLQNPECKNNPIDIYEYQTLRMEKIELKPLYTVDLGLDFHMPSGKSLDPYLGLIVGYSPSERTRKTGMNLGVRYFMGNGYYVGTEAFSYRYKNPGQISILLDQGISISTGKRFR